MGFFSNIGSSKEALKYRLIDEYEYLKTFCALPHKTKHDLMFYRDVIVDITILLYCMDKLDRAQMDDLAASYGITPCWSGTYWYNDDHTYNWHIEHDQVLKKYIIYCHGKCHQRSDKNALNIYEASIEILKSIDIPYVRKGSMSKHNLIIQLK